MPHLFPPPVITCDCYSTFLWMAEQSVLICFLKKWWHRLWSQRKKPCVLRFNIISPDAEDRDLEEYKVSISTPGMMKILLVVIGVAGTLKPVRYRGDLCPACPPPVQDQIILTYQRGEETVQRLRERTLRSFAGRNEEKLQWLLGPKRQSIMNEWKHQGPDVSIPLMLWHLTPARIDTSKFWIRGAWVDSNNVPSIQWNLKKLKVIIISLYNLWTKVYLQATNMSWCEYLHIYF